MTQYRVLTKRIVAANGTVIAEAKSVAIASDADESIANQIVAVKSISDTSYSSYSTSYSSSKAE